MCEYGLSLAAVLRQSAHRLWGATLVGHPVPKVAELHAEIKLIRPGDMVAELTTFYMGRPHEDAVGRLVACRREALRYDDPEDYDRPLRDRSEVAWYIELLDGRVFRWHNASFIRVLEDPVPDAERAAWAGGARRRHDIAQSPRSRSGSAVRWRSRTSRPAAGFDGRQRMIKLASVRQKIRRRIARDDDPKPVKGMARQWVRCRRCDWVGYYDYVPFSLSRPILTMGCGCWPFDEVAERIEMRGQ